jgi:hypothetical protein
VKPLGVPHAFARRFDERMTVMLLKPLFQVEVVELLAPQHAGQSLPVHTALIFGQRLRRDPLVELVGFGDARVKDRIKIAES